MQKIFKDYEEFEEALKGAFGDPNEEELENSSRGNINMVSTPDDSCQEQLRVARSAGSQPRPPFIDASSVHIQDIIQLYGGNEYKEG